MRCQNATCVKIAGKNISLFAYAEMIVIQKIAICNKV